MLRAEGCWGDGPCPVSASTISHAAGDAARSLPESGCAPTVQGANSGGQFGNLREAQIALCQSLGECLFDQAFFAVTRNGDLTDQQVAGALQHFFLAER